MTTWRPIPHIYYKVPDAESQGKHSGFKLIEILLNLALIDTFKDEKYKKFAFLYSTSYDNGICNIEIITPEVNFIANFERMFSGASDKKYLESLIVNNMNKFSQIINNLNFGKFIGDFIVYDGQSGKITLGKDPLQMDVATTSGLLFHLAGIFRSHIVVDYTGAIIEHENYKKLMLYDMDYGRIDFDRIKINVDNFEEWDYYFPEYDQEVKENKAIFGLDTKVDNMLETTENKTFYDIAFSFAGEDRGIVEEIAEDLISNSISVFYDNFEKSELWGKRLDHYFKETYAKNTRFVIPFISEHYPNKDWTNFEFSVAHGEAKKRDSEFILPVRIDDTHVVGIPSTIGYLDYNKEGKDGIVKAILSKLRT
ncbi:TIR domain-containing protein [Methanococcoides sp.]|jgi:hypothetical protein|uniref:TIR domain-containing protein n=1 Tax=Methanococcoides sp. TaxID=1966350 RepID=UPI00272E8924|nr:TIR domain-containing protein [Methanococcoides sp.]